MRLRPITALSLAAASMLLMAGCSGSAGDSASPSTGAAADLCAAQAPEGDASKAVSVSGDAGTPGEATFTSPLDVSELQTTVVDEGSGDAVAAGDFISYALSAYSAETGEKLVTVGYEPGELLPAQISPDNPLGQLLGCGKPGERVVAAFPATPASDSTQAAAAEVYVVDLLDTVPTAAWGDAQEPVAGMPAVELADDGAPTITIPDAAAPTETQVATLKQGDGYTVQDGDYVLIQYSGARWSNGEVFDETWKDGGTPYSGATTSFVSGFQKALVGFPVGSQVEVVIPPAEGYGEGEINTTDLKGETLVFVVDILGAQHVTAQQ
ncbi:FKBP-type peptidyl-prolyl cis-trans isomerase [Microbacterium sp. W1N]|uniref:FKBP-type peptidyl-prolyl cis-trans isomerase n=1 Tax=Microbacterium festucae TaxID=2977531 RepID=UPI0021BFE0BA|nr:FKBP-type peptidyl-prolyl cis-trans isomerase [Microbacterium festucae]MCT9821584.1 FKBP-type peptidyl-prolyl cis-trans isomerase [Microbacterium festucae]